jgi:chromosome segregation ATPase
MSLAEERRYATLQRRLENEGYKFGFGSDSIPLTEKLLDDLVSVRGTFQTLQDQFQELRSNELRLQRQVQPLQRELSRVVRENNQLHLELIQRGEDLENNARRHNLQEKRLSADVTDKTFVIHQQFHQIRELERDLSAHKERIERLLDKNFTCTAGPTGDLMPKGQDLHISKALSRSEINGSKPHVHQVILDLDSEASNQITTMKKQLESFAGVRQELELEISSLQKAVENRDLEIQRLGKLLETNINSQGEEMAQELEEKADIIRRLNGQIDFLTAQIVDSDSHGQGAKHLKNSRDTEIDELKTREAELLRLLDAADSEKKRLHESFAKRTLVRDSTETEQLLNEIAALRDREKDLMESLTGSEQEVQRLRGVLTTSNHDAVDQRSLERQMRTYANQIASMDEALSKSRQLAASYLEQAEKEAAQADEARAEVERLRAGFFPENAGMKVITGRSSTESELLSDLQHKCDQLTEENSELISSLEERQQRCDSLQEEANEMRRLRDGLAAVVLDFENQLIMVQENIRDLSCEREAKDKQIETLSESLRTAEEEIGRQRNNPSNSGALKISEDSDVEQSARQKRDSAAKSFKQGQTEDAQALSEKLQASNASVSMLQVRLETALGDLRSCSSKEQAASKQLLEAQAKCAEKESAIRQLQTLMTHLDETRGDVASRLQGYMEENSSLKDRLRTMELEVQSLQSELKRRDDDVDRARSAISTVDGERDSLLLQLEDRAERIHKLEALRSDLEQKQSHSLANFMTAQQQVDLLRQALGERDAQVRMLQEQVEAEGRRRSGVEGQLALRLEEARNLTSDLSIMTRENQVVNTELAALVSQREALKRDLDETFERLAVAEQLVQGREKERDDVLMSYRALNEEKVRAEASLDRCSSECHQLRAQVLACATRMHRAATLQLVELAPNAVLILVIVPITCVRS